MREIFVLFVQSNKLKLCVCDGMFVVNVMLVPNLIYVQCCQIGRFPTQLGGFEFDFAGNMASAFDKIGAVNFKCNLFNKITVCFYSIQLVVA